MTTKKWSSPADWWKAHEWVTMPKRTDDWDDNQGLRDIEKLAQTIKEGEFFYLVTGHTEQTINQNTAIYICMKKAGVLGNGASYPLKDIIQSTPEQLMERSGWFGQWHHPRSSLSGYQIGRIARCKGREE